VGLHCVGIRIVLFVLSQVKALQLHISFSQSLNRIVWTKLITLLNGLYDTLEHLVFIFKKNQKVLCHPKNYVKLFHYLGTITMLKDKLH